MNSNGMKKLTACVLTIMMCATTIFTGQNAFGAVTETSSAQETETVQMEPSGAEATMPSSEVQDETSSSEAAGQEAEPQDAAVASEESAIDPTENLGSEEATEETPLTEELLAEDPEQYAEETADSWRYKDGQLTEEAENINAQMGATIEEQMEENGNPLSAAASSYGTSRNKSWRFKASYTNGHITCSGGYLKGIDVSVWQGDINWDKVKKVVKSGKLDFVIIRCGYGKNTTSKDDSKFARNVKACESKGIPYGVYLYSYAKSESDAKSEANHALRLLKGHHPDYPVYYDLEDNSILKSTKSKTKITKFARTFCSRVTASGYKAGIYANLNWFEKYLNGDSLHKEGYDLWVARWPISSSNYTKYGYGSKYSIWQCGSSGSVDGIKTRVDTNLLVISHSSMRSYMNRGTTKAAPVVKDVPSKIVTAKGKDGKTYYYIKTKKGNTVKSAWVTLNGKRYYATKTGALQTGIAKIGSYIYGFSSNGEMYKSSSHWFGVKKYSFDGQGRAWLKVVKVKKKTSYRTGPGKKYKKKGKVKKGKTLYVINKTKKWVQLSNGYWIKKSCTKAKKIYPIYKPAVKKSYTTKMRSKYKSRTGPGTSYIKKKTYKKGKKVKVIGLYNNWAQLSSGYWVPLKVLKK